MSRRGGQPISFNSNKSRNRNKNFHENEDAQEEDEKCTINYMQPEILPPDFMIEMLTNLGMRAQDLNNADKIKLSSLFLKHLSPKPQRDYDGLLRVMKKLKKNRKKYEKVTQEADWTRHLQESKKSSNNLNNERLKPAPTNNSSRPVNKQTRKEVNLDDLVIISRPKKNKESSPEKKVLEVKKPVTPLNVERKTLQLNKRKLDDDNSSTTKKTCSVISLKRTNSESDKSESENESEKKKKKPIGWP